MSRWKHPIETIENEATLLWLEIEHWQRDNPSILSGYRRHTNSYFQSFASLYYWHNETVNIYSHLLGAILFGFIALDLSRRLTPLYKTASKEDFIVFACFFGGCISCLTMSGVFHLITDHSDAVSKWGNQLDYLGIVLLIWGSFIPSIYYGFQERPNLVKLYWSTITLIGLATAYTTISPSFRTPECRAFRAVLFIGMGLSALMPVTHGLIIFGYRHLNERMKLSYVIVQGVLYISGAALYAARIPEKIWPGKFDLLGSSHQIFHFLVLAAAASHLVGLVKAFHAKHTGPSASAKVFGHQKID